MRTPKFESICSSLSGEVYRGHMNRESGWMTVIGQNVTYDEPVHLMIRNGSLSITEGLSVEEARALIDALTAACDALAAPAERGGTDAEPAV